jgi:hypothetical protein
VHTSGVFIWFVLAIAVVLIGAIVILRGRTR